MNGSDGSIIRAIRGPITLITVGALFALNNFTEYGFDKTWPVLLIVFGLLSLIRRGLAPVPPPPPGPPPYSYQAPGGYTQSPYAGGGVPTSPATASPGATAKGGFGTSAPPRASDAGQGNPAPPAGDSV